jgi:hypothetical protein
VAQEGGAKQQRLLAPGAFSEASFSASFVAFMTNELGLSTHFADDVASTTLARAMSNRQEAFQPCFLHKFFAQESAADATILAPESGESPPPPV